MKFLCIFVLHLNSLWSALVNKEHLDVWPSIAAAGGVKRKGPGEREEERMA